MRLGITVLMVALAIGLLSAQRQREVRVFVPCGMIVPFQKVKAAFEKQTGIRLRITYDNGVALVRRIRDKGERPDVFVSPGELEMRILVQGGFIDPKSVITFGTFDLILVVPARSRVQVQSLEDLTKPTVRRIILADPKQNSVGYYAQQALMRLGLWEKVKGKVVTHWHAQETVNYVCMGRVDAGLFYATCPFDSAPEKVFSPNYRIVAKIPSHAHDPVKVQAGMLKEAKNKTDAQRFLRFLLEPQTQKMLAQLGIPNFPNASVKASQGKPASR